MPWFSLVLIKYCLGKTLKDGCRNYFHTSSEWKTKKDTLSYHNYVIYVGKQLVGVRGNVELMHKEILHF